MNQTMQPTRHAPAPPYDAPQGSRGSVAVELALVLPVLLLFLFGIIEIANIMRIQFTLESAVTAIAHDAAMHYSTQSTVQSYMDANNLLPMVTQTTNEEATPPVLSLTPSATSTCKATPCTPFEVKLTYKYKALTDLTKPFFDNLVLSASVKKISEPW